ncbi:dimethylsulfonioproprionate lyase family protein [Mesorhizobium sp. SB112]|uniref:dimethylsulfonioproprionate lyase family protein n=1 Tax=Mesorhizobium sp. SB112 TaxID=3151853 RepID=UPI003263E4B9
MTSNTRPHDLQAFLDAMRNGVESGSPDSETKACLARVVDALRNPVPVAKSEPTKVPTSALLQDALKPARAKDELKSLAQSISNLAPLLTWRRRAGAAPEASASFAEGHANAMIVGPGGLEDRADVWVGLSLLAPDVRYPDHRHSPEEIYLFLTDGRFRQGEDDWFTPGVGGTLYNEPNIFHAIASVPNAPLLALWCLFDPRHS